MNTLTSLNPSKGYEPIGVVDISTPEEVTQKVNLARQAQPAWQSLGVAGRSELFQHVIANFSKQKEQLAQLMSQEMGMPIKESRDDIDFGIDYLNAYLKQAVGYFKSETTYETATEIHHVYHEPYGVVAVIVPWNFPFTNFVWQAGQNLIAGNTIVFKHSEETPLFGKALEEILTKELLEGVFNEVYGDGTVGELLVNSAVDLICFTGSLETGRKINVSAAQRLIPTVLELGGSAPGIILEDTDLDSVKDTIYNLRFMNAGQMCDALKRLIVHESRIDEVVQTLAELIKTKRIGEANDEKTDLGPLVAKRQLDILEAQVADAVEKGATVVTGGKRPEGLEGAYYEPTILTKITPDMRIWQEEVFGPVLPIIAFTDEAQAIRMANHTDFGLGAYIFTKGRERFNRVAAQLKSGMVAHNNVSYINVNNPFGGYKLSGNSREHNHFGFDEVTQIKVVAQEK